MSNAHLLPAIVVIRRKACESDSLLSGDLADLRQTHQDGYGGWQSDAVNAIDQPKPLGKVGMLADRRGAVAAMPATPRGLPTCSPPATARGCPRAPHRASFCRYRSQHRSWYAWPSSSIPPL